MLQIFFEYYESMSSFQIWGALLLSYLILFLLRFFYLLYVVFTSKCELSRTKPLRTIFVIGSGGHTTELLRFVKNINMKKYTPRLYILADNDVGSPAKIHETEKENTDYSLMRIPRCRNVRQSPFSAIISTIFASWNSYPIICDFNPDVIFCNGPGTCIPVCLVAFTMRCFFQLDCRTVFIESVCRVRTLSLSGKILQFFADIMVIQWPQLRENCFRARYFGRLT